MKYLKKFEKNDTKYKINDYVYLKGKWVCENLAKIVHVFKPTKEYSGVQYVVRFYNNDDTYLEEGEVERLLTPEEIEYFNLQNNMKKYNL